MQSEDVKRMIEAGIPGAIAMVEGSDGRHFEAIVVSPSFAGKRMLEQHKMVYAALGKNMEAAIHALSIRTYTPEQWQRVQTGK